MKTSTILFLVSVATILSGCTNENINNNGTDGRTALRVSGSVAAAETKVTNTSWDQNDAIGIFMLEGTNILEANREYVFNSSTAFAPATTEQTIYFPVNNDAPKVDFVAYYPWNNTTTNTSYAIDLSNQNNQAALDLMVAEKITGRDKNDPAVAFNFTHRLVNMVLVINSGTGLSDADLDGLTVAITDQYTTASCNLNTGVTTPSGNTQPVVFNTATDGLSAEATILPAEATTGKEITFTLSTNEIFRYAIPSDRLFNVGERHNYTITLHKTAVEVTATITDWTNKTETGDAI